MSESYTPSDVLEDPERAASMINECLVNAGDRRREIASLHAAVEEARDWLRDRVLSIIPEIDRPATQARIDLLNNVLCRNRKDNALGRAKAEAGE